MKEAVKLRIFLEVELELAVVACLVSRWCKAEVGHGGMSVEVGFDSHHVLAEAAFVFVRVVHGACLKDENNMVKDGFTNDEVEVALALVPEVYFETVDMLEYELALHSLGVELQDVCGV